MQIDLTVDEAQVLLDGINVVIKEQELVRDFWRHAPIPQESRTQFTVEIQEKIAVAKSAQAKIRRVK